MKTAKTNLRFSIFNLLFLLAQMVWPAHGCLKPLVRFFTFPFLLVHLCPSAVCSIVFCLVLFCLVPCALGKYSGGSGTPSDPYRIADHNDLYALADDVNDYNKCFIQTSDIDLDPNLPGRRTLTKALIAPDTSTSSGFQGTRFTGTFDGNDCKILNLRINGKDYCGLFGYIWWDGAVSNLGVEDVNIRGVGSFVGGLAGTAGQFVSVTNCCATGAVWGNGVVGGLVGDTGGGTNMTKCYATGAVSGVDYVGGLVGYNGGGTVGSSFWDVNTSGTTVSDGGLGKTTAEMQTKSTFTNAGWDFNDVWDICEGTNYPRFIWQILTADFVCPDGVTFPDYSFFSTWWLRDDCEGADIDFSGAVDIADLQVFCNYWLEGI